MEWDEATSKQLRGVGVNYSIYVDVTGYASQLQHIMWPLRGIRVNYIIHVAVTGSATCGRYGVNVSSTAYNGPVTVTYIL